jgi:hypothetical protein
MEVGSIGGGERSSALAGSIRLFRRQHPRELENCVIVKELNEGRRNRY